MRLADKTGGIPQNILVGAEASLPEGQLGPAMFLSFLLQTPSDLILIATGDGEATKGRTLALLQELGVPGEAISKILLTRMHGDHISGLFTGEKKTFPGLPSPLRNRKSAS